MPFFWGLRLFSKQIMFFFFRWYYIFLFRLLLPFLIKFTSPSNSISFGYRFLSSLLISIIFLPCLCLTPAEFSHLPSAAKTHARPMLLSTPWCSRWNIDYLQFSRIICSTFSSFQLQPHPPFHPSHAVFTTPIFPSN